MSQIYIYARRYRYAYAENNFYFNDYHLLNNFFRFLHVFYNFKLSNLLFIRNIITFNVQHIIVYLHFKLM